VRRNACVSRSADRCSPNGWAVNKFWAEWECMISNEKSRQRDTYLSFISQPFLSLGVEAITGKYESLCLFMFIFSFSYGLNNML
jgi:hypothetical protein